MNRGTAHSLVAISYSKSFVMCEQFSEIYNGNNYSTFVRKSFPFTFVKVNNNEGKSFSQDVDSVQNCKELYQA